MIPLYFVIVECDPDSSACTIRSTRGLFRDRYRCSIISHAGAGNDQSDCLYACCLATSIVTIDPHCIMVFIFLCLDASQLQDGRATPTWELNSFLMLFHWPSTSWVAVIFALPQSGIPGEQRGQESLSWCMLRETYPAQLPHLRATYIWGQRWVMSPSPVRLIWDKIK